MLSWSLHKHTCGSLKNKSNTKVSQGQWGTWEWGGENPICEVLCGTRGLSGLVRHPSFPGKGQDCGQRLHAIPAKLGIHSGQSWGAATLTPGQSTHEQKVLEALGLHTRHTGAHARGPALGRVAGQRTGGASQQRALTPPWAALHLTQPTGTGRRRSRRRTSGRHAQCCASRARSSRAAWRARAGPCN